MSHQWLLRLLYFCFWCFDAGYIITAIIPTTTMISNGLCEFEQHNGFFTKRRIHSLGTGWCFAGILTFLFVYASTIETRWNIMSMFTRYCAIVSPIIAIVALAGFAVANRMALWKRLYLFWDLWHFAIAFMWFFCLFRYDVATNTRMVGDIFYFNSNSTEWIDCYANKKNSKREWQKHNV